MLVDSGILIYAAQPAHTHLWQFIAVHAPAVSAVSYVEVLGYHQLDDEERQYLEAFFRLARGFPLSQAVLDQAVALRQQRKMSLGDALVAGTAMVHRLTLVTRNVEDFQWIRGLSPCSEPAKVHAQITRIERQASRVEAFVAANDPKRGKRGQELQSHVTNHESANMQTAHGVIQGYHGQALVDAP